MRLLGPILNWFSPKTIKRPRDSLENEDSSLKKAKLFSYSKDYAYLMNLQPKDKLQSGSIPSAQDQLIFNGVQEVKSPFLEPYAPTSGAKHSQSGLHQLNGVPRNSKYRPDDNNRKINGSKSEFSSQSGNSWRPGGYVLTQNRGSNAPLNSSVHDVIFREKKSPIRRVSTGALPSDPFNFGHVSVPWKGKAGAGGIVDTLLGPTKEMRLSRNDRVVSVETLVSEEREQYQALINRYATVGSTSTPMTKAGRGHEPAFCIGVSPNLSTIPPITAPTCPRPTPRSDRSKSLPQQESSVLLVSVRGPRESEADKEGSRLRFRDLIEASRYLQTDLATELQNKAQVKDREWRRLEESTKSEYIFHREQRISFNKELDHRQDVRLRRLAREPGVVEDLYVEPEPEVTLPELTEEMRQVVRREMRRGQNEMLSDAFRLQVTRLEMDSLRGRSWLTDMVINFYMQLICHRSIEHNQSGNLPKAAALTTFFYPKLRQSGFSGVRRWTKKTEIFNQDLVFVPIHLGVHWCLACIDVRKKTITYYDSMGGRNNECVRTLLHFLEEESKDKRGCPLNTVDWQCLHGKELPQQNNGSDCGVFTCQYAEYLSRDVPFSFTCDDMPYFRERMMFEILKQRLLT